jgi:hypothetical protein
MQIISTLRNVKSFLGVFPSDLLPHSIARSGTIINADPHTEQGSHWLAILLRPKDYSCYYFDTYGLPPFIPNIHMFLRRTCVIWDHNKVQLQGLSSDVCDHYCCVFALYMDRGFTPQQFVGLFNAAKADRQIRHLFASEFGQPRKRDVCGGGQCCFDF